VSARHVALTSVGIGPFFEERHRELAAELEKLAPRMSHGDPAALAKLLGELGLYRWLTEGDVRALVIVRDVLGFVSPLADALFAVQGLGSYPLVLAGSEAQRAKYLPECVAGTRIAAFALTEPEAGSDVASLATRAARDGDAWLLDGDKTLISNVPIADHYVVFARAEGTGKTITAFLVERDAPGLELVPQPMSIEHPIGKLRLRACRVPDAQRIGAVGEGMKIALATLERFRVSVGAAANGMAAAALDDALAHVRTRVQFGKPLAEQQMVQAYLAEMATELDAGRLLVARAAWVKDTKDGRAPAEVAMAKMYATEAAQRVIDRAVQLLGGRGVLCGSRVEALYRDIRPLRIYEGTTEIQKLIIARTLTAG
jgi:acyl-CoA dehydrogenase